MIIRSTIILLIIFMFVSCFDTNTKETKNNNWKHKVLVEEVIQTGSYTYLLVSEEGKSQWIAVSKMDANAKDVLYYNSGLEMIDFRSKELQRTFNKLLLVQVISDDEFGISNNVVTQSVKKKTVQKNNTAKLRNEKSTGLVTISELFTNSSNYGGKSITIRAHPNITSDKLA